MMTKTSTNIGGVVHDFSDFSINVGGVTHSLDKLSTNVGGVAKDIFVKGESEYIMIGQGASHNFIWIVNAGTLSENTPYRLVGDGGEGASYLYCRSQSFTTYKIDILSYTKVILTGTITYLPADTEQTLELGILNGTFKSFAKYSSTDITKPYTVIFENTEFILPEITLNNSTVYFKLRSNYNSLVTMDFTKIAFK